MYVAITLAFIWCFNSFASTCTETKVQELQIQDQDGLGTCYANQTALLIQNAMKSESPVSYQQISMAYAMLARQSGQEIVNDGRVITEGGNGCHAFRAAQEIGWCKSNTFESFDFHGNEDPLRTQEMVLEALGTFIDKNADSFSNYDEKDWSNIKTHIEGLIGLRKEQCESGDIHKEQFSKRMGTIFWADYAEFLSFECAPKNGICQGNHFGIWTEADYDRWKARYKEFKERFMVYKNSGNLYQGKYYQLNETAMEYITEKSKENGGSFSDGFESLLKEFDRDQTKKPFISKRLVKEKFIAAEKESNIIAATCKERFTIADLLKKTDLNEVSENPYCHQNPDPNQQELEMLESLANEIVSALKETSKKTQSLKNRLSALLKLVAPGCSQQMPEGKDALSDLHCTYYSMTGANADRFGGKTQSRDLSKNRNPEQTKVAANTEIRKALCAGRAVGVDVCTGFLYQEGAIDTSFCRKKLPNVKQSGHAMTIVGFRSTPSGQSQYLVQNSWGRNCTFESPETLPANKTKKSLQCEKDQNGRPTGRFWIGQNLLLNNTLNLNIIEKDFGAE